jgi:iron complex transport system substrate-binding protein
MRIVSLLPAATEIVFGLGLGDELVGRTHACDYPPEVVDVPVVTSGPGLVGAGSWRINQLVTHASHGGSSLFRVDADALAALEPDLILTQELCETCAVGYGQVSEVARALEEEPVVVSVEPRSVEGIFNAISTVGAFAEAEDEAVGLLELLRERLGVIENRVLERRLMGLAPRRVVVLEWLAPPFVAGHWVPEMVRRAGGWELLGQEGRRSTRTSWERVREVDPEQVIVAPCGFDAAGAALELSEIELPEWFDDLRAVQEGGLFAVDGSGLFSRPGPRVVDGIGLLAELFDPEGAVGFGPPEAWVPLGPTGMRAGLGR